MGSAYRKDVPDMSFLDGPKLTYGELVEVLCNLAVRLERLEDYVVQFNHDVSVWTEFETGLALTLQDDMANYKVPYGTVRQIDNKLSNYIAYNEGKKGKGKSYDDYIV